jgi:hypothetical protein
MLDDNPSESHRMGIWHTCDVDAKQGCEIQIIA